MFEDPNAPLADPEQAAFGSLLTLEANDPALDTPLPDGTIPRQKVRATLETYVTRQRARNLPLFPNLTAEANQKRTDYLTGLFTKPLAEVIPADAFAKLEARAASHPDPDKFRKRETNRAYLSALVGKPLDGPSYEAARAGFSKQHLGLPVTTDDATFHAAVTARFNEDAAAQETVNKLRNDSFQGLLMGQRPEEPDLSRIPERHRENALASLTDAKQEARRVRRTIMPKVDKAFGLLTRAGELEKDYQFGSQDVANNLILSAFRETYPENKADRPLYLALLAQKLQSLPEDQRGLFERAVQATARTINTIGENVGDLARGIETTTTGRAGFTAEDQDLATDFRQFQRLYQTEGAGLKKATDTFLQRGVLGVAQSLPYTIAAIGGPYGMGLNAMSFAGESVTEQRIASPNGDRTIQLSAALVSGTLESAIETTITKLGLKAMAGKLPTTFALLNRAKLTGLERGVVGGLATAAQVGVMEYGEEFLQAGTRELTSAVARDLSNLGSPYDWQSFFKSWGEAQRDIIPTVTIFALIAGGGASYSHFRQGSILQKNRVALHAMGIPEAKLDAITNAPTAEAADALTQAAAKEGLEARSEAQRQQAIDVLRETNQLLAAANLAKVTESKNTFTGESEWTFTDPLTNQAQTFETEEAALDHWRNFASEQRQQDLDSISSLAEDSFIDFIQSEGTASADTEVEVSNKTLRISDVRAELAAKEKATLNALDKETNPVRVRDLNDTLAGIRKSQKTLDDRIHAFVLQHGPAAAAQINNFTFAARRFREQTRTGLSRYVIQLFKGRSIQDVIEDFSEDFLARGIDDGIIDPAKILADIRAYQSATGDRLIDDAYEYDADNMLPLLEAFAPLARAAAMSQVRNGTLPPEVSQWIELETSIWGATANDVSAMRADLARVAKFKQALDTGTLTPELEALIQDSIGLNDQARAERFEKQARAQLAAEAMEGFPEISDAIAGRLPHPQTLRQNQHPLTGEVRALWEALLKPTRRRSKAGRTIDRTNEANAFFLPVGQMVDLDDVLRTLNERGFDFENPADMLDAAIDSLAYGKPHHGTRSMMDESFAIGQPSDNPTKINLSVSRDGTTAEIISIKTPAAQRGQGHARRALEALVARADAQGITLFLSAEPMEKGVSKAQLVAFYKSLGFVSNTGRNKDFRSRNAFVRPPATPPARSGESMAIGGLDAAYLDLAKDPEKNREKLQSMVDAAAQAAGYDIGPVYHGTRRKFTEFKISSPRGAPGNKRGVYFSPDQDTAAEYAEDVDGSTDDKSTVIRAFIRNAELIDHSYRGIEYRIDKPSDAKSAAPVTFDNDGNVIPISQRFDSTKNSISYAISLGSLQRIEAAIARKLTAGPEERAEFYERLRNRLAATVQRIEDTNAGIGVFGRQETEDPIIAERRRIQDAITEARAIIDTLPPEARGRVGIDYADLTNATTERGRVNALLRLIDKADEALETLLRDQYQEALEKLSDLAKPNLSANRQIRGRLTPEIQRVVNRAIAAMALEPTEHQVALITQQAKIAELETLNNASTAPNPELGQQLVDASLELHFLETFGNIGSMPASQLAGAYRELLTLYSTGRSQRNILDEARRAELMQARREVLDSLKNVNQAEWAKRTAPESVAQRAKDIVESLRFGLLSFHQAIEWILPDSIAARDFQASVRAADRYTTRAKIDADDRLRAALAQAWGFTGISTRRKTNRVLAALSRRRDDWNIEIREANGTERIKMSEEQAARILAGEMTTGWETDPIVMESLRQSLADFRAQRRKAQAEDKAFTKKVIQFDKVKTRGPGSFLNASDLEAVYWLQLWDQEQYRPTLDKHGFTEAVITQIRAKLDRRATAVADHLRREYNAEYDRLNPVFRRLYNLDLPRIRNYAPGQFENIDGSPAELDAYGNSTNQSVNAMSAGFTKSRTHHMARPRQQNALGLYWSHLEATEYFIGYAEVMRDAKILFRNPELRRKIEGIYGSAVAADWSRWLDALEVDGQFRAATTNAIQRMTQTSLNTTSAVGLAYNVGTLFKQASAAFGVMMEMPTGSAIRGLIGVFQNPRSLAHIWNTESIQQRIIAGMSPEDRRLLEASKANPSLIMELLQYGRLPIAYADGAFTTVAGAVAYQYHYQAATKSGLADSQAHEVALAAMDRVITRTAQPATTQDKSLAELTTNGFGKFLFLFKSDPRQKFAIAADALVRAYSGKMPKGEAARRVLWSWMLYGIMAELMTDTWHAISRDDDDPERWSWEDYLASALVGPVGAVQIIGPVMEYIVRAAVGTKAYANSANPIDKAAAAIFSENGLSSRILKDLAEVATGDKPLDLTDLLAAAQRDTAAIATLAGAFDSRAAILPALLRAARDAGGMVENAIGLAYESDNAKIQRILEEAKEQTTTTREKRTTTTDDLEAQLVKLSPEARETRLAAIAKTDRAQATSLRNRLRNRTLTPEERTLDKLPAESRAATIAKILAAIDDPVRREKLADRYALIFPEKK